VRAGDAALDAPRRLAGLPEYTRNGGDQFVGAKIETEAALVLRVREFDVTLMDKNMPGQERARIASQSSMSSIGSVPAPASS
jgi:hypothetical protein